MPFFTDAHFDQTAFVINAHSGTVFNGLIDVVDVYIVTKHRLGIDVICVNRGTSKAQVGGIG